MGQRRNDHAGILYLLDSAGRTIEQLELRVEDLTAQVAQLTVEREQLRRELEEVRTGSAATSDVPPHDQQGPENGPHDPPIPPA